MRFLSSGTMASICRKRLVPQTSRGLKLITKRSRAARLSTIGIMEFMEAPVPTMEITQGFVGSPWRQTSNFSSELFFMMGAAMTDLIQMEIEKPSVLIQFRKGFEATALKGFDSSFMLKQILGNIQHMLPQRIGPCRYTLRLPTSSESGGSVSSSLTSASSSGQGSYGGSSFTNHNTHKACRFGLGQSWMLHLLKIIKHPSYGEMNTTKSTK